MSTDTKPQIDVYTYPTNASPLELARYQVAVMEAGYAGALIQNWHRDDPYWSDPFPGEDVMWNWTELRYRVARPKIAEGHNPAKLTEDQVGVKDGWRLLSVEERTHRDTLRWTPEPTGIFLWNRFGIQGWSDGWGNGTTDTYRTKAAPGFYLPKPKPAPKLVPWTFETAPKGCVLVRQKGVKSIVRMIVGWDDEGFRHSQSGEETYANALKDTEHSTDNGATFHPCGTYSEGAS